MKKTIFILLLCRLAAAAVFAADSADRPAGQSGALQGVTDPQILSLISDAEKGDAAAQFLLGFFYANGQGVAQDYQAAVKWYTLAAEQGHSEAPLILAMMYLDGGEGVQRDLQQAVRWYTMAAGQGKSDVQLILSELFAGSDGNLDNPQESYKWLLLAEANGRNVSDLRSLLVPKLTQAQIIKAQEQAAAFLSAYPKAAEKPLDQTIPKGCRVEPEPTLEQPQIAPVDPNQTTASQAVNEQGDFTLQFPSSPKRTILQDTDRLTAIHYQALTADGKVQYNASFQNFKTKDFGTNEAKVAFLEEYLAGRAFVAWKNTIQKKFVVFQGQTAAKFKHTTFSGETETVHEGLIFIVNNNFISLTCVYPADIVPAPTFNDFVGSFKILTAPAVSSAPKIK